MIRGVGAILAAAALIVPSVCSDLRAAERIVPIHHEVDVKLDPDSRFLSVSDVVTVTGRTEFRFDIAPWLSIERLSLDQRPIDVSPASRSWRTNLPDRGQHQIALTLRGKVPAQRGGRGSRQATALGPDGGFLFERAGWIPETGDDQVSYRLRVEVPVAYRAVATGRLDNETIGQEVYSATFTGDYPEASPSLFVGPYKVREQRHDGIRIRTYFHRDLTNLSDIYLRDSAQYLTRYATNIGPYPYSDFHIISAPIPVGLGFPNLTYIGQRILPMPFIRARSLAHEVLHNWWGNGITVDYQKGNWAEGLTTYMADYALVAEKDAEKARQMRLGWLRDYAALPAVRDIPVTQFTAKHDDAAQVIGYNKVAFLFHMLKGELGDANFSAALQLFWKQWRSRRAGWDDLRQAFESISGRDLQWFFNQWLHQPGAPRLHLDEVELNAPSEGGGKYHLRFSIRQKPPVYRLTIPAIIETETGPRPLQIKTTGAKTTVNLETDSRPTALHVDRNYDLFRRLSRGEAPYILRDVTLAANVITIIVAKDKTMHEVARKLARRLLDTRMQVHPATAPALQKAPHLIIGSNREVENFLTKHRLSSAPDKISGRGTARAWTGYGAGAHPVLVIAAKNTESLQALLRPLPHYGRRSYVVFDGRRAIDKGIWSASTSPLSRQLN